MTSEKKIQANRRNAKHSTGPRSAGGRDLSRRNAVKTGLYARTLLLDHEDRREYQRLRAELFAEHAPVGPTEEALVQLIMDDVWRLNRLRLAEAQFLMRLSGRRRSRTIRYLQERKDLVDTNELLSELKANLEDQRNLEEQKWFGPLESNVRRIGLHSTGDDDEAIVVETVLDLIAADDLGPTLFEAYVPSRNPAPMEEVSRQRRTVTRDLFRNIESLLAMQERRKVFEGDKD